LEKGWDEVNNADHIIKYRPKDLTVNGYSVIAVTNSIPVKVYAITGPNGFRKIYTAAGYSRRHLT